VRLEGNDEAQGDGRHHVRAILAGQQPVELTPTRLVMLSRNLPHNWQEQRRLLGFAPA
jgi:hypothetical protein